MKYSIMSKASLAGVALAALVGAGANAATINITGFTQAGFDTASAGGVVEDFETGYTQGAWDPTTVTAVGTFETLGGSGSGSTCSTLGTSPCTALALQNTSIVGNVNNQGNIVPDGGTFALNSADTNGIFWDVFLAGAAKFSGVVFALRDAADIQGTTFTVTTNDGTSQSFSYNQGNGNLKLVVIDFGFDVSGATVSMSTAANDAFTIDGATVMPAPVPVPAAGLLLLTALGGLGVARRRRKAA